MSRVNKNNDETISKNRFPKSTPSISISPADSEKPKLGKVLESSLPTSSQRDESERGDSDDTEIYRKRESYF